MFPYPLVFATQVQKLFENGTHPNSQEGRINKLKDYFREERILFHRNNHNIVLQACRGKLDVDDALLHFVKNDREIEVAIIVAEGYPLLLTEDFVTALKRQRSLLRSLAEKLEDVKLKYVLNDLEFCFCCSKTSATEAEIAKFKVFYPWLRNNHQPGCHYYRV